MPGGGPTAREHLLYTKHLISAGWMGRKGHQGWVGKSDLIGPEHWASQHQGQGNQEAGQTQGWWFGVMSRKPLCGQTILPSEMDNISSLRFKTVKYLWCNVGRVTRAFPDPLERASCGSSRRGLILLDSIWHDVSNCHAL